jgi:hypothetical protein
MVARPGLSHTEAAEENGDLMWGAIAGLHTRYPDALSSLKEGWWRNATHLETLSALAVWRQWIDDASDDPREELAFQVQLANYRHALRQADGRITLAWQSRASRPSSGRRPPRIRRIAPNGTSLEP